MADLGLAIQRAEDKTEQMRARACAVEELEAAGAFDDLTAARRRPGRHRPRARAARRRRPGRRRAGEDEGRAGHGRRRRTRARAGRRKPAMIVRISGEGQFKLPDDDAERAERARQPGGQRRRGRATRPASTSCGRRCSSSSRPTASSIDDDELVESDVILPPRDIDLRRGAGRVHGRRPDPGLTSRRPVKGRTFPPVGRGAAACSESGHDGSIHKSPCVGGAPLRHRGGPGRHARPSRRRDPRPLHARGRACGQARPQAGAERRGAARADLRRAGARHRQGRRARRDPLQAGTARRARGRAAPRAFGLGRRAGGPHPRPGARGRDRAPSPRALRRARLPGRPGGRREPAGEPHPRRGRCLRGDERGPPLPARPLTAGRGRRAGGRASAPVRPRGGRRARGRASRFSGSRSGPPGVPRPGPPPCSASSRAGTRRGR